VTIDPDTLAVLKARGIDPRAFEKFAAAENASLRAEHQQRLAARGKRQPMRATLADLTAAVRARRAPATVADKLGAIAARVYGRAAA
jgi:hypothetical protein